MLNIILKGATILRQGCLFLSPFIGAKYLAKNIVNQVELNRQTLLYDQGVAIIDKKEERDNNGEKIIGQLLQMAFFSYASYGVMSGKESPLEFVLSCEATVFVLYPHAKKAAQLIIQSNAVEQVTNSVFQKVKHA